MQRLLSCVAAFAIPFAVLPDPAVADDWAAPRASVIASDSGRHFLRMRPNAASQFVGVADNGGESVAWERRLINVPVRAWISNDGLWVVTVDTYGHMGYEHALVIYDRKGKVVADYPLEKLLKPEEIKRNVVQSASSRWWTSEAKFRFELSGAKTSRFAIDLPWGRRLRVRLEDGDIAASHINEAAKPGEIAPPLPGGRYSGAAEVLEVIDGKRSFRDTAPAICHLEVIGRNRIRIDAPDVELGRGKWSVKTLPISTTAPRRTYVLVEDDRVYNATVIPYSPRMFLLQLRIKRDGKIIGGANQYFGVVPAE